MMVFDEIPSYPGLSLLISEEKAIFSFSSQSSFLSRFGRSYLTYCSKCVFDTGIFETIFGPIFTKNNWIFPHLHSHELCPFYQLQFSVEVS